MHAAILPSAMLAAAAICCTSFVTPPSVFIPRSSLGVQHDNRAAIQHYNRAAIGFENHDRGERPLKNTRQSSISMSSSLSTRQPEESTADPTPPVEDRSPPLLEQQVDRRTLLTKTIPVSLVAGALGIASVGALDSRSSASAAGARATVSPAAPGSKVVVLGGNGFVGSRVCEVLVEAGE